MEQSQLERVLAGDVQAFRYFVECYQDMAYTIALSIVKTPTLAEEVTQDAFLKAFKNLKKYRQEAKFSSWLYRIVYHEALKTLKRQPKQEYLHHPDPLNESRLSVLNEGLKQLALAERQQLIQTVLAQLKPKEALVLQLFYLNECSLQEMNEQTGISLSNLKVLLHRGRHNFYQCLEGMGLPNPILE
ncbi:MAG: sigma-70 family RNA polymerase sigma factor [Bacteroidota bacterium]